MRLARHAWFESNWVLTRLPIGLRRSPSDALRLLLHNFPASQFLEEEEALDLTKKLARIGVAGGSVYDALVGAAATQHKRTLATRDERARPVYEALGVTTEVVA